MNINLSLQERFENRHHGKSQAETQAMLISIGLESLEELINQTIPANIRLEKKLDLPRPLSEVEFLEIFKIIASRNQVYKSFIGTGYYDTIVPNVILRNILENPAWYTAYTPYQAEIAQGRLEMLLNFQTLVIELTGMEIANASLLDEGTAAAEALAMMFAVRPASKKTANTFFISELCHPQTIEVVIGRAEPLGIEVVVGNHENIDLNNSKFFGALVQYPASNGEVYDYSDFINKAHTAGLTVAMAADLMGLLLLKSPAEMGADVVIGSAQRFGVPMGYGGPHAGFFATKDAYKRQIPGRIIGVSVDSQGKRALRMALQTREQHIRREKATSNICTAQVLLSVMASAYSVYHGKSGLQNIAQKIHGLTKLFAQKLTANGIEVITKNYFDTLTIRVRDIAGLRERAEAARMNFRYNADGTVGISFDETKTLSDLAELLSVFGFSGELTGQVQIEFPANLQRQTDYLNHAVFNSYQTEHEMLRYLKSLESKDLSLVHSMISLGSCTMKLNATAEMIPVTWKEIGGLHPFAPENQTKGYQLIFKQLNEWLCEITGFDQMSLQPNSGAQGEYAGLMVIRAYHHSRGEAHRKIALIPSSAHGTNPASAVMAGMQVVVVKCDERGNIDVADLQAKAEEHSQNLACLMVTYPSTHGVFEESIIEICEIIHQHGGQVYMDGANMNAQVGLTNPATIGADVCHLNLHKTFCIPHGGGGPGMGPIGVRKHLTPFLPSTANILTNGNKDPQQNKIAPPSGAGGAVKSISSAPFGSASILPISYAYIAMMGADGLTNATKMAILNANYIKSRLETHYPILYTGTNGRCAHEMIVDCREFKATAGIEVEDIAKRLMDYGFHAPTVSFPVAGTLMIEPTESESKIEIDRFCDALIQIREEIREIENGLADKADNVLKNAPHTAEVVLADAWNRAYSREKAAYPLPFVRGNKFFPAVSRIDSAYGDRNLVCACDPISEY